MKLGNTSQSIVPVPNIYLTRDLKNLETFNPCGKKKYFREKDLFRLTKDINLSNNPRNSFRKFDEFNRTKYVAVHKIDTLRKKFNIPEPTKPEVQTSEEFAKFTDYMYKTNVSNYINQGLKEEIKSNIGNLLDRINSNFDLNKWNLHDTKTSFLNHNTESYTGITMYNHNNESENTKFKNTLRDKINSLNTVDEEGKFRASKNFQRINQTGESKLMETGQKMLEGTIMSNRNSEMNKSQYNRSQSSFDKNPNEKIINDNKSLYEKFQNTSLYKEFPSPTRMEFTQKKGEKISYKRKKVDDYIISFDKYNSQKHKNIFCEPYTTNDGAMCKFGVGIKATFN
jgi:hypothetical protein